MREPGRRPALAPLLPVLLICLPCPAGAAQWTESPGEGWTQLTVFHQDTREEYGESGEVRPFFADGHAVTTSVFLTSAVGILEGMDGWVELSLHRLEFDDAGGQRRQTGAGDMRFHLRAAPVLFGLPDIPLAVRGGVKIPGSDFPVDAEVIPLTEGQRDWELILEAGHSFYPAPVYAQAWAGYRWRELNAEIRRDPGDERFLHVALGGETGRLTWKAALEGLWGLDPEVEGLRVASATRRLLEVIPTVGWKVDGAVVEVGAKLDVSGRNFPEGPTFSVGAFLPWRLP